MLEGVARLAVTAVQLREYLDRDWSMLEATGRVAWRRRLEVEGPGALLAAIDAERAHLQSIDPTWPTADDRASDLAALVLFKQRIDAASSSFTGRPRPR